MIVMGTASNAKRSSPKEYRCNLCGRIFDNAETLNSHKRMATVRKDVTHPFFQVPVMQQLLVSNETLYFFLLDSNCAIALSEMLVLFGIRIIK